MSLPPSLLALRVAWLYVAAGILACDAHTTVRGVVVGPEGRPVPRATVTVRRSCDSRRGASKPFTTSDAGEFAWAWVGVVGGEREYAIDVAATGFDPVCQERIHPGGKQEVRIELRSARPPAEASRGAPPLGAGASPAAQGQGGR